MAYKREIEEEREKMLTIFDKLTMKKAHEKSHFCIELRHYEQQQKLMAIYRQLEFHLKITAHTHTHMKTKCKFVHLTISLSMKCLVMSAMRFFFHVFFIRFSLRLYVSALRFDISVYLSASSHFL